MVSISRNRVKGMKLRSRARNGGNNSLVDKAKAGIAAVFVFCLSLALWMTLFSSSSSSSTSSSDNKTQQLKARRKETTLTHPDLHIHRKSSALEKAGSNNDGNSNSNSDSDSDNGHDLDQEHYNAIALDIIRTLHCQDAFDEISNRLAENKKSNTSNNFNAAQDPVNDNQGKYRDIKKEYKRRLEEDNESADDLKPNEGGEEMNLDDGFGGDDFYQDYQPDFKARYLFCLAAYDDPGNDEAASYFQEHIHCDASNTRRQALLDLWDTARAAFRNTELLTQVVDVAIEQEITLLKERLHVWAPYFDDGMQYTLTTLNDENHINADHGGLYGLSHNLGHGKLFVDVGSCLGFTSMAVTLMYPDTRIISIEAAPPNWLMQELNWRCQPDDSEIAKQEHLVKRLLAGVGPVTGGPQFALMLWRRDATTSTRSWTANSERKDSDIELNVELKPWHSLLAEVGLLSSHDIDVLYVDCEGCEYNLIPSMSESEFQSIPTVIGEMHWGYIPKSKLPSSERAKITHERLCKHENMASTAKECCAFPDLPVLSSVPGEVLLRDGEDEEKHFPPLSATVSDVAGELCDDFDVWAKDKFLWDIRSDWGWFQLTSTAEDELPL